MTDYDSRENKDFRFLLQIIDERDRQYNLRFEASEKLVATEVRALRETTTAMMGAFKEAMQKAEQAQGQYNTSHNDLARKMEAQYQHMMPREEASGKIDDLKEAVSELQKSRCQVEGKSSGLNAGWAYLMGGVILIATVVHLILSLAGAGR